MKTVIILIITLIFSMFMAVDKDGVKINNKTIQTYPKRVVYCFMTLIIFASIISWFTILPILGLLSLL
ncbi:hypothetical protein [Paraclostridium bifermentans]|uniref:hypothetical protein n=1 Tax=Paraclostridium bifermentans TaxID=1490 RepID=UPI00189EEF43|nr:hypothetical protein [Paraclostridium bifermentans]